MSEKNIHKDTIRGEDPGEGRHQISYSPTLLGRHLNMLRTTLVGILVFFMTIPLHAITISVGTIPAMDHCEDPASNVPSDLCDGVTGASDEGYKGAVYATEIPLTISDINNSYDISVEIIGGYWTGSASQENKTLGVDVSSKIGVKDVACTSSLDDSLTSFQTANNGISAIVTDAVFSTSGGTLTTSDTDLCVGITFEIRSAGVGIEADTYETDVEITVTEI